jgi:hypothetical protein
MTSIVHIRTWYIERAAAAGSDLLAQSLKTEQKIATNWSKRHHRRQLPAVMAVILPYDHFRNGDCVISSAALSRMPWACRLRALAGNGREGKSAASVLHP